MNSRILASVIVIMGFAAVSIGGAMAYFSDVETSSNNTITAGTLDLKLSHNGNDWYDGATETWTISNFAPGKSFKDRLYFKNDGTTDGKVLLLNFKAGDPWNKKLAKHIEVELREFRDGNWYGPLYGSLYGLITKNLYPSNASERPWSVVFFRDYYKEDGFAVYEGQYLPAGTEGWMELRFTFDEDAMNDLQGQTTSFDLELALLQYEGELRSDNLPIDPSGGWTE